MQDNQQRKVTTLDELSRLRTAPHIRVRVEAALAVAAKAVHKENPADVNYLKRRQWARRALKDVRATVDEIMWSVVADPAIVAAGNAATDAQILAAVAAVVAEQID